MVTVQHLECTFSCHNCFGAILPDSHSHVLFVVTFTVSLRSLHFFVCIPSVCYIVTGFLTEQELSEETCCFRMKEKKKDHFH